MSGEFAEPFAARNTAHGPKHRMSGNGTEGAATSRRALLGGGVLLAAVTALGGRLPAPSAPPAPSAQPHGFVLWGSSSAASQLARQHPPGYRPVRIEDLLSELLDVPGTTRAVSGDVSWQTLSMRSHDHPYVLDLASGTGAGSLPGRGSITVASADGRVPGRCGPIPGTVAGVRCSIQSVPGRSGAVLLRRDVPGDEVALEPGAAVRWHTGLEEADRGRLHLLWMGKNNIEDIPRVLADTAATHAVEPATSVVMGQWCTYTDRRGTVGWDQVQEVNAAHRRRYGAQYHDVMADLRDPELWDLPALRPYRIGASRHDRRWLAMGLPPRSIVGSDRRHLNALGNTIVAHGLHRYLTGPGAELGLLSGQPGSTVQARLR